MNSVLNASSLALRLPILPSAFHFVSAEHPPRHKVRVYVTTAVERVVQHTQMERDGGLHPFDHCLTQRALHAADRLVTRRCPDDYLGDETVIGEIGRASCRERM